jgi:adenylate cyclase
MPTIPTKSPRRARLLIAFCDIDGFTGIARRLGDDLAVFELMDGFVKCAESTLLPSGLIVKWIGDEFLYVSERADEGLRALLEAKAALESYLAVSGCGGTLRLQAHVGEAVIGNIGSTGLLDVYGDSVNRAATFCRERRAGSVVISPEAFRALSPETRRLFRRQTPQILYIAR